MTLLDRADALQCQARKLLHDTGVVDLFAKLGTVHPVGSYQLDLMYRPDIDLIVTATEPRRDRAVAVTKQLLDIGYLQTIGFADWNAYRDPSGAKGYYWELRVLRGDDWWKLDVWYTKPDDDRSIEPADRFARLLQDNPAAREIILAIKAHYFDGTKYRDGVTGFAICDAVLNRRQMSVESFAQAWNAGLA